MKLQEIIDIASGAYPDGLVAEAAKVGGDVGDGLAEFIAREITETFEPDAIDVVQLSEAIRVMEKAEEEIGAVAKALRTQLVKS